MFSQGTGTTNREGPCKSSVSIGGQEDSRHRHPQWCQRGTDRCASIKTFHINTSRKVWRLSYVETSHFLERFIPDSSCQLTWSLIELMYKRLVVVLYIVLNHSWQFPHCLTLVVWGWMFSATMPFYLFWNAPWWWWRNPCICLAVWADGFARVPRYALKIPESLWVSLRVQQSPNSFFKHIHI